MPKTHRYTEAVGMRLTYHESGLTRPLNAGSARHAPRKALYGLKRLLPVRLASEPRTDGMASREPRCSLPDELAALFDRAYLDTLAAMDLGVILGVSAVAADEFIGTAKTSVLWALGCTIVRFAPIPVPAYTRFHRLAMAVADHLDRRGIPLA